MVAALVAAALVAASAGLIAWNVREWRAAAAGGGERGELDFRRRQFRRRVQTSGLLGVLGLLILGGQWIAAERAPNLFVFYWVGVAVLTLWMALLALGDLLATRLYAGRQQRRWLNEQLVSRAALERSRKQRASQGNGREGGGSR